jgi:hypothetical protein
MQVAALYARWLSLRSCRDRCGPMVLQRVFFEGSLARSEPRRKFAVLPGGQFQQGEEIRLLALALAATAGARLPQLIERDQSLPPFVPQHKTHASQTLNEGKPSNAFELGIVAQDAGEAIIGNATA